MEIPRGKEMEYLLAGNCTFTVAGPTARITYRVERSDDGRVFHVSVIRSSDHEGDWWYIGTIFDRKRFMYSRRFQHRADSPEFRAFARLWLLVKRGQLPPTVRLLQSKYCARCGMLLTTPESIERGMGPVCAKKAAKEARWAY